MNICVYGAASETIDPSYLAAGEELGRAIGQRGWGLVFGGGNKGMMGACARGVHEKGGHITGIIPHFFNERKLDGGVLFPACDKVIFTDTMRQRKQHMEDLSDAFIVTPGGVGTFDEFFEILTLQSLGQLTKPVVIYNLYNYYAWLFTMLDAAVKAHFVSNDCRALIKSYDNLDEMLAYIAKAV